MAANHWLALDGGGKWRQHKYVAFCGYLDYVDRLEAFSAHWKRQLDSLGLRCLHTSEAMAWQGEWKPLHGKWGETRDEMRAKVIGLLIDVIKSHPTMVAIGICADSRALRVKSLESTRPDLMLFERAVTIATNHPYIGDGQSLSIVCDWEDGFDELCCKLTRKLRVQNIAKAQRIALLAFGDDEVYPELQAADLLAYLACQELERKSERPGDPVNRLYERLTDGVPLAPTAQVPITEMFTADEFKRMVESH